jgi:hypothetical protein
VLTTYLPGCGSKRHETLTIEKKSLPIEEELGKGDRSAGKKAFRQQVNV